METGAGLRTLMLEKATTDVSLQNSASCWFLLICLSPQDTVSNLHSGWHTSHFRNIWINKYWALIQDRSNSQRQAIDAELDKEVAMTKQSFIQQVFTAKILLGP